ncbi:MAG: MBL fold metallo-hydrolase, partial [Chrysiogenales bacterium]
MSVTSRCIPRLTSDRELYSSMEIPAGKGNRNEVTCTWIGTAGLCISDSVTGILVDPYVSRFSIGAVALRRPLIPDLALVREWSQRLGGVSIRAVIVSHSHFDHAADAPYFTRETGALLVGSESTLNIGRGAGLEEKRMRLAEPGRMMKFGYFSVEFIESLHGPFLFGRVPYSGDIREPLMPPGTATDYRVGTVFSLRVRHRAGTLLHHGSAGFINGMYDRITTDVILMG